jgi:hypothetical protein
MIIYGNRLFGKVDQVPGLGHVATRFFHIDYVPLIPYEGWLVTTANGKAWRGVKIPISAKSLLIAWGRTAGVVAGVGGVIGAVAMMNQYNVTSGSIFSMLALAVLGWGFFAFTKLHKSCTRASYKRACELGKLAKLSDDHMAAIAKAYGEAPVSYGFAPVQTRRPPALNPQQPAAVIPLEPAVTDFDQSALEEIPEELIPVEGEDGDDDRIIGLAPEEPAPTQPIKPRGEIRRHG